MSIINEYKSIYLNNNILLKRKYGSTFSFYNDKKLIALNTCSKALVVSGKNSDKNDDTLLSQENSLEFNISSLFS